MRKHRGFTLTELIIVLATIAIVAAVAIPKLLEARLEANEVAASETIALIGRAETQFRVSKKADLDKDGRGEYGFLKELAGATGVRTSVDGSTVGDVVKPPALSAAFGTLDAHGEYQRSGYLYRVFLPDGEGDGVAETELFPLEGAVDPQLSAKSWCCYAWPTRFATSGNRTFFVNDAGVVTDTQCASYSGPGRVGVTNCGAALVEGTGPLTSVVGAPAVGATGRDEELWSRTR